MCVIATQKTRRKTHLEPHRYTTMNANEISFGIEFETTLPGTDNTPIGPYHHGYQVPWLPTGWKAERDGSIRPENSTRKGCEFVSPILKGIDGVRQVENAIDQINARGGRVNASCGLHITIGFNGDAAALARLISLIGNHERAIYASTGTRKREQMMYAKRIKQYGNKDNAKTRCEADRYHLLNLTHLKHGKNRIEFRAFAGTLNKTKVIGYLMMVLGLWNSPSTPNAAAIGTISKRKYQELLGSTWCRAWRNGAQSFVLPAWLDQGLVQRCPPRQGLRRNRRRYQTRLEGDQDQTPRTSS